MPASPRWGGFYKRLARSVTLGRALVYTSSDDVHETLTQFHFMYGRFLINYKLKNKRNGFAHESANIPEMVRKLQDKINCYWSSFSKCYLNELRQFHIYCRKKQSGSSCKLEIEEIVLNKEDFKV